MYDPDCHVDCQGNVRRDVIKVGMLGFLGLGLSDFFRARATAQTAPADPAGTTTRFGLEAKADAVIVVWAGGGLSHIDSWDPKPTAPEEIRGAFGVARTNLPGVAFSEHMANCAKIAGDLCVIRSMNSNQADHDMATHYMMTGYPPLPGFGVPAMGSVVAKMLPQRSALPPYIAVPDSINYGGAGFLGAALDPFAPGGDPNQNNYQVRDLAPAGGLTLERVERRRSLREAVDAAFRKHEESSDAVAAVDQFYNAAYSLISSTEARAAFDLSGEPEAVRNAYGRNRTGQGCLLARRLIEAGVRFVTVSSGGWDHHENIFGRLASQLPPLDQAVAALISDLKQRGMLERTLVLVAGEFGRTPQLNATAGRDHWSNAFSVVGAGGGLAAGAVIGATDPRGMNPVERPVKPEDLSATVYNLLGIDHNADLESPEGIRIVLSRGGEPVREAIA